jgi:hypothetical protein
MEIGRPAATIGKVRDPGQIKRYTLVPRAPQNGKPDGVRRFSLARVGTPPRSGVDRLDRLDRLERMERIAEAERDDQDSRS